MKAITFEGVNVNIAEGQEEYQTLPARVGPVPVTDCPVCFGNSPEVPTAHCEQCNGQGYLNAVGATFCFELSPKELAEVNRTGKIWHTVVTFGQPLQPQSMTVEKPPFVP